MHLQLQRNKWKNIETGYRSLKKKKYIKNKIKEGKRGEKTCRKQAVYQWELGYSNLCYSRL